MADQRDQWTHPTTVKRAYERTLRIIEIKAAADATGEPVALSPMAQFKQALIESRKKVARLERQVRDSGSLVDLPKDHRQGHCQPDRALEQFHVR